MRLVKTDNPAKEIGGMRQPRSDYLESRAYKKVDQLLYRVLQLNEILRKNCGCGSAKTCACNSEKALDLKEKIWRAQKKLDRLYAGVKHDENVREALTRVEESK